MSARWPRLARAATVGACLATLVLDVLGRSAQPLWPQVLGVVIPLGYTLIGTLIWERAPSNAIGPLFSIVGLWLAFSAGLAQSYAVWALLVHPGAPAARPALWLASPAFDSLFFLVVLLLLQLFPDGRPMTPRWRLAVWTSVAASVLGLAGAFQRFNIEPPLDDYRNPYIVHGQAADALNLAGDASSVLMLVSVLSSVAAVVVRFHRARGIERLQLRWFAAAVVAILSMVVVTVAIYAATGVDLSNGLFLVAVLLLPAAVGVAILRYRLYEIDVLIRRTIIYASLVTGLGAVYLAGIVLLDALLGVATGQTSNLAVTGSTLVVAIVFQPLRRRIQAGVDHRFYRSRYDVERTLAAFSGQLRQEIDLDQLEREMLDVVRVTVHPGHARLWIRERERGS